MRTSVDISRSGPGHLCTSLSIQLGGLFAPLGAIWSLICIRHTCGPTRSMQDEGLNS